MTLREQIDHDLKEAMKDKDKVRLETIRMLRSAIRYAEIEVGHELDSAEVLDIVLKQVKQRRDSISQYEQGGRPDLASKEMAEVAILQAYLPQQLTSEDVETKAKAIIAELGVTDAKGMGQVMKRLTAELKGQADGKLVSQIVKQLLTA
jgi:hypothetical protein